MVDHRLTRWLGHLSYGIYLWHRLVLYGLLALALRGLILYPLTAMGTLMIAAASYHWVEAAFLRLKNRLRTPHPAIIPSPVIADRLTTYL